MSWSEQGKLFQVHEFQDVGQYVTHENHLPNLDRAALLQWKAAIARYQQRLCEDPPRQIGLFAGEDIPGLADLTALATDPMDIDPFSLQRHNFEFYRWQAQKYPAVPALYFVLDQGLPIAPGDQAMPILLYIGETVRLNQRWKGWHDCKRYVQNYYALHYQVQVKTTVCTAFWPHAPAHTRNRQQLELQLIERWKSPFNKENWTFWGTPFTGGKLWHKLWHN